MVLGTKNEHSFLSDLKHKKLTRLSVTKLTCFLPVCPLFHNPKQTGGILSRRNVRDSIVQHHHHREDSPGSGVPPGGGPGPGAGLTGPGGVRFCLGGGSGGDLPGAATASTPASGSSVSPADWSSAPGSGGGVSRGGVAGGLGLHKRGVRIAEESAGSKKKQTTFRVDEARSKAKVKVRPSFGFFCNFPYLLSLCFIQCSSCGMSLEMT